jgi:RNA polymerase primary sigma factor
MPEAMSEMFLAEEEIELHVEDESPLEEDLSSLEEVLAPLEEVLAPQVEPLTLEEENSSGLGVEEPERIPLSAYKQEMRRYPRIPPERESRLGRRIKKGREAMFALVLRSGVRLRAMKAFQEELASWQDPACRTRPCYSQLTNLIHGRVAEMAEQHPSNRELARLNGRLTRLEAMVREASHELVTANLRLVFSVAKGYANRGLAFSDLIQDGNLGLIKAASMYDYSRGFRFSTYAIWWIRQAISRSVFYKGKTVRYPNHFLSTLKSFYRAQQSLLQELFREPTLEEIAGAMGESEDKVQILARMVQEPLSLDAPQGEAETNLGDYLPMTDQVDPLDTTSEQELRDTVQKLLANLPLREEMILRKRFGIATQENLSLEEVGGEFHISRERVRQLEHRALARLRHPARVRFLESLI